MRLRSLFAALALLVPLLGTRAEDQVVGKSPQGEFTIVDIMQGEADQDWIVSASHPAQREKLGLPYEAQPRTYFISPDGRWIFADIHIGSGMGGAALFRQKDGLHFVPFEGKNGRLDDLLWRFYTVATGGKPSADQSFEEMGIVDFVSYSPDSARILISLRGGVRRGPGFYGWLLYLNTRTGKLEQTPYLKAKSRGSEKRWTNDDVRDHWSEPASAEPIDPLPDEAQLKSRWEQADQRLNAVYARLIAAVQPERKKSLRDQQRAWLAGRDPGAAEYAKAGAPNTQAQRRWQYLGDATEIRISELTRELNSTEN